jgi:hypothetical protein
MLRMVKAHQNEIFMNPSLALLGIFSHNKNLLLMGKLLVVS